MAAELSIDVDQVHDECVVRVRGEVDMATAPRLEEALADLDSIVVVDLDAVTFLDSTGIAALVRARNRLLANHGDLKLRSPRDNVKAVLQVVGLTGWIE